MTWSGASPASRFPKSIEPYRQYIPLAGIALAAMLGGLFVIQVIRMMFPASAPDSIQGQD